MIDIENYISRLIALLQDQFGSRLVYVGLQGSYLRGEATDHSDIDIMVVMDKLTISDMDQYRAIIQSLECADKSCGFICGKSDLANWNPLEIAHVLNSTKDYLGVLRDLVPAYTQEDLCNFIKLSLNNLYHEICHRYIHADSGRNCMALPGTYKSVFYILQNWYYLKYGKFVATKNELLFLLDGQSHAVLKRSIVLNSGIDHDFTESFALLFDWCQEMLQSL